MKDSRSAYNSVYLIGLTLIEYVHTEHNNNEKAEIEGKKIYLIFLLISWFFSYSRLLPFRHHDHTKFE